MRGLTTSIDATTNIPSVIERAKASFVGFDKQVGDIGKRFSTGFKDIFLGFFAPMAIFQTVMGFITDGIAKAKQDAQDGLDLIAKGETLYASAEEKKMAAFFKAKKAREDEIKSAEAGKIELTKRFLEETPKGQEMLAKVGYEASRAAGQYVHVPSAVAAQMKDVQDAALKAFLESPEGKMYQPIFGDKKDAFKTPEGFSNVVGVGPSPVMEAMAAQLEEAQKQTALLEKIAGEAPGVSNDFTKGSPIPTRAGMLVK